MNDRGAGEFGGAGRVGVHDDDRVEGTGRRRREGHGRRGVGAAAADRDLGAAPDGLRARKADRHTAVAGELGRQDGPAVRAVREIVAAGGRDGVLAGLLTKTADESCAQAILTLTVPGELKVTEVPRAFVRAEQFSGVPGSNRVPPGHRFHAVQLTIPGAAVGFNVFPL